MMSSGWGCWLDGGEMVISLEASMTSQVTHEYENVLPIFRASIHDPPVHP